ncbi:MAG: hypothetical protein ACOX0X_02765 [Candidatus Dojkabacteria bacterium]
MLIIFFAVAIGSLFLNRKMIYGMTDPYNCRAIGESCSPVGSKTVSGWFVQCIVPLKTGCDTWACIQESNKPVEYDCSGTDTKCSGKSINYYASASDCNNQVNALNSYCCGSSGPPRECGCGTQHCQSNVGGCNCTYWGCKIGNPRTGEEASNMESCIEYTCSGEECRDCTLDACPTPLVDSGDPAYKLVNYRSCQKTGSCAGTKYGDCYEVPNAKPTPVGITPHPSGTTVQGCSSTTHTGLNMNNPVNMTAVYEDVDGANDIEAIYVWFSTSNTAPVTPAYIQMYESPGQPNSPSRSSWGFMMHKEGSRWVPYLHKYHKTGAGVEYFEWYRTAYNDNRFAIKGPSSQDMVFVNVGSITLSGNRVEFKFSLDFRNISEANRVTDGKYNIFLKANDIFGFTPYDNYPSTVTRIGAYFNPGQIRFYEDWKDSGKDWNIDLVAPSVNSLTETMLHPTSIQYSWSHSDLMGLYAFVSNMYVSQDVQGNPDTIKRITLQKSLPSGTNIVASTPYTLTKYSDNLASQIGNLNGDSVAKVVGINTTTLSGTLTVDIGANREKSLLHYMTAIDLACNVSGANVASNLEDWIITQGGLLYSARGVQFKVREVEDDNLWNGINLLNRVKPRYSDISSEMYGNIVNDTTSLKKTVNSYSIGQFKAYRDIDFYKDIKTTFEKRELGLQGQMQRIAPRSTLTGNLGGGPIKVMDVVGDLTVGSPTTKFVCDGKGLFFVSGNLFINGEITNANRNKDACIFVVKGNASIGSLATKSSSTSLAYDEINAYILVNGDITISSGNSGDVDGLYINGGIHSLGRNGITMSRYLGLIYRSTHPAFFVDHHSKYGMLSTILIGNPIDMVKVEVGFKPF